MHLLIGSMSCVDGGGQTSPRAASASPRWEQALSPASPRTVKPTVTFAQNLQSAVCDFNGAPLVEHRGCAYGDLYGQVKAATKAVEDIEANRNFLWLKGNEDKEELDLLQAEIRYTTFEIQQHAHHADATDMGPTLTHFAFTDEGCDVDDAETKLQMSLELAGLRSAVHSRPSQEEYEYLLGEVSRLKLKSAQAFLGHATRQDSAFEPVHDSEPLRLQLQMLSNLQASGLAVELDYEQLRLQAEALKKELDTSPSQQEHSSLLMEVDALREQLSALMQLSSCDRIETDQAFEREAALRKDLVEARATLELLRQENAALLEHLAASKAQAGSNSATWNQRSKKRPPQPGLRLQHDPMCRRCQCCPFCGHRGLRRRREN